MVQMKRELEKKVTEMSQDILSLQNDLAGKEESLREVREEKDRGESQLAALGSNLASVRQQLEGEKRRGKEMERRGKMLDTRVEELTLKIKTLQDERRALLEKVVGEEERTSEAHQLNAGLQKQVQQLEAALQELGREHQTLQVMQARASERKWESDRDATACSGCGKKFSVSVRKHHCRSCGHIFCQTCTSHSTILPSSKKPVRVCNTCFSEIAT
ncbi:Early endosome antigen 1 [Geodia barretti]|nr:Early endosome antigen 1 [Geodia barretti]